MQASDTFIDWIDLRQDHAYTHKVRQGLSRDGRRFCDADTDFSREFELLPLVHGGVRARGSEIVTQSEDGKVFYLLSAQTDDKAAHGFRILPGRREGSHSTSVLIHSDGRCTRISGNVGRLDRRDNLFNYGWEDTIYLCNREARAHGLPEFSRGDNIMRDTISADYHRKGVSPWKWSGAFVNELHVTRNYSAGSDALAIESMRDMRGRRLARVSKAAFGDETINFGMPQKRGQRLHRGVVVYRKGPEMLAHAKGDEAKAAIKKSDEYQLAMEAGVIRVEVKLGALFLRGHNLRYLGDIDMAKLIALYNAETAPLLLARPDNEIRLVEAMPRKLRMTALSWIDGRDMRSLMAPATFKRHRKALLDYGLDITEARRVDGRPNAEESLQRMLDALPQHALRPLTAPDWYGLPEVDRIAA